MSSYIRTLCRIGGHTLDYVGTTASSVGVLFAVHEFTGFAIRVLHTLPTWFGTKLFKKEGETEKETSDPRDLVIYNSYTHGRDSADPVVTYLSDPKNLLNLRTCRQNWEYVKLFLLTVGGIGIKMCGIRIGRESTIEYVERIVYGSAF